MPWLSTVPGLGENLVGSAKKGGGGGGGLDGGEACQCYEKQRFQSFLLSYVNN